MTGIGRIVTRRCCGAPRNSLLAMDFTLLGCSVCVAVIAAQRGSEMQAREPRRDHTEIIGRSSERERGASGRLQDLGPIGTRRR